MSEAALLISTRRRVVITKAEKRHLDYAARDVRTHGDKMLLECGSALCPEPKIVQVLYGGREVLRCGCSDRHIGVV